MLHSESLNEPEPESVESVLQSIGRVNNTPKIIDWPTTESEVKLKQPTLSCLLTAEGDFIIPDLSRAEHISDFSSLYDLKDDSIDLCGHTLIDHTST